MSALPDEPQRRHWRRTLRLTGVLLVLWFAAGFGVAYFARELDFPLFGFPFSVWVASQGAPLIFLLIVWRYARAMKRLDREHGAADE